MALRWVMKRGIDLRGFTMEVDGMRQSGPVLLRLMAVKSENGDQDIATYYAERGALMSVDMEHNGKTALTSASYQGYHDTVRALLAAGADTEKADTDGSTALMSAASGGPVEVVQALLAAGAGMENLIKGYLHAEKGDYAAL